VKGQSVPLGRYFLGIGGVLLALLLFAGWYLPDPPPMPIYGGPIDSAILHIRSEHKWPQRLQFDTSTPATLPPSPPVVAAMPTRDPKLDALAQARPSEKQVTEKPPLTSKPHVATKRRHRGPAEGGQFAAYPAPSNWTLNWQQARGSWY
jgi:hypothetical protein